MGLILGPAQWLRIQPLAWELPYATGVDVRKEKKKYSPIDLDCLLGAQESACHKHLVGGRDTALVPTPPQSKDCHILLEFPGAQSTGRYSRH